jgi:cation diffusion facilitator CzcD-associated flavoprotein CzcO
VPTDSTALPSPADTVDHEILIVGAGFSGIGTAAQLEKVGIRDYLIVEQGDGFGGTWYWNRYPGIAVDIPSFSYQYSYAKSSEWSRTYAPGDELLAYAKRCAREHDLGDKTRFKTKIVAAEFDTGIHAWRVSTGSGEELVVRHIVDASGVLTVPKKPDIPGVDSFAGETIHTARWDQDAELAGKRVAVIGTGASAVQLIPEIAPEVEHLTVFQRTPIWCLPKFDKPLPGSVRWALDKIPGAQETARVLSQAFVELTFPLSAHYYQPLKLATLFEGRAKEFIAEQVDDPEMREKLTPQYGLGCKRPSFHNSYLSTFNRENVSLETNPITEITETGIRTADGAEHEIDVLVLATGFKVFDPGNFPKYPMKGRGGKDLETFWRENRFQAYEGVSVPDFPNYFMVMGPYGYNGSSYFNLVETQSRHIVRCLNHARGRGATLVEVSKEANDRYFAEMLRRRKRQIFWQDSCGLANSYYFDDHGDVPLRPVPTIETMWRAHHYPLDDYRYERLGHGGGDGDGRPVDRPRVKATA